MLRVAACSTRARWIAIGATLSVVAVAIAALAAWWSRALRGLTEPATRAGNAYDKGQWAAAEREAREVLKVHRDDPSALRVLARSSARLGRDDAAIALYSGRE